MIIELVRKELTYKNEHAKQSRFALLRFFLKLIMIGLLGTLIWFIFSSLDRKINSYSEDASYHFLVLFLFVVMVVSIISATVRARVAIFSKKDARITLTLPIPIETLIIAKVIYIYLKEVMINFVLSFPLLLAFGLNRAMHPEYYVFSFFYPAIISIFSVSFALLVVVLVQNFYKIISKSTVTQFVLAALIVIGLCFVYQFVLEMFLNALNDSQIGGMFSSEFVEGLKYVTDFLVPVNQIFSLVILKENMLANSLMFVGIIVMTLVLGVFVVSMVYFKYSRLDARPGHRQSRFSIKKVEKPWIALLKKELTILFKDSGNMFSYTALLIMAPFLSFVVISSLDNIMYQNMSFILTYYPELINGINVVLILLFVGVINSSVSLSMSREGKALQIMKYIPISPIKQIIIKLISPILLSSLSLALTLFVLLISGNITGLAFMDSFILGFILVASNNILGIEWDMKDKGIQKTSVSFLNSVLAMGFPLIVLAIHFGLSFLYVDRVFIYLSEIILGLLLLGLSFIKIKERYTLAFRRMEVH